MSLDSLLTKLSWRVPFGREGSRTSVRGARQVFANGAWAAVAASVPAEAGGWPLFAGALSAAQADTWASEIGAWSRTMPRLISTGEPVPHGMSGAISVAGIFGGVVSAGTTAAVALWLGVPADACGATLVGGILGMLADSWFGASVQAKYYCDTCRVSTEKRLHLCKRQARVTQGLAWFDNDVVNLVAAGLGAATALGTWYLF